MEHRKETVFIIEWLALPTKWRDYIKERYDHCFVKDTLIHFYSEFEPINQPSKEEGHYGVTLTAQTISAYHKDQVETNGFEGDLKKFIEEYGLEFEIWMLKHLDLNGVKTVLINVSW